MIEVPTSANYQGGRAWLASAGLFLTCILTACADPISAPTPTPDVAHVVGTKALDFESGVVVRVTDNDVTFGFFDPGAEVLALYSTHDNLLGCLEPNEVRGVTFQDVHSPSGAIRGLLQAPELFVSAYDVSGLPPLTCALLTDPGRRLGLGIGALHATANDQFDTGVGANILQFRSTVPLTFSRLRVDITQLFLPDGRHQIADNIIDVGLRECPVAPAVIQAGLPIGMLLRLLNTDYESLDDYLSCLDAHELTKLAEHMLTGVNILINQTPTSARYKQAKNLLTQAVNAGFNDDEDENKEYRIALIEEALSKLSPGFGFTDYGETVTLLGIFLHLTELNQPPENVGATVDELLDAASEVLSGEERESIKTKLESYDEGFGDKKAREEAVEIFKAALKREG